MKFLHFILISFLLHLLSGTLFLLAGPGEMKNTAPELTARRGIALDFRMSAPRRAARQVVSSNRPEGIAAARTEAPKGAVANRTPGVLTRRISAAHWGIRYPPLARAMGKEGQVTVRCRIGDREQSCGETELLRSSGFADLDRAALEGVRKYNRFRPLAEKRLLDVTISFRLLDPP